MAEDSYSINSKASILLSRNHPVALVVGAAGFLGSHLVDQLLVLNIQVIGVDDLSSGRKENLVSSFKSKTFHFLRLSIEESQVREYLADLPRLDYAFFIAENRVSSSLYKLGLDNFLKIILGLRHEEQKKADRPKVIFVSSIEMYDSQVSSDLSFLKEAENIFAKLTRVHQLNARIVRLAEVFGPRMHFRQNESISRLIRACLEKKLVHEQISLDFSTRGLFVNDAVTLLIKSILSGSTSGKIYDGCLVQPIKVSEIKQILLDPVWYKHRGFTPTELPPWPTPNLERSIKELSWRPKSEIVNSLKQTVDFFEQNDQAKEFALQTSKRQVSGREQKVPGWSFKEIETDEVFNQNRKKRVKRSTGHQLLKLVVIILLILGLVFPVANFLVGSYYLPQNLAGVKQAFEKGEMVEVKKQLAVAKLNLAQIKSVNPFLVLFKNTKVWETQLNQLDELVSGEDYLLDGVEKTTEAFQDLNYGNGPLASTGEEGFFKAESSLSQSLAELSDPKLKSLQFIPNLNQVLDLTTAQYFYQLAQQGRLAKNLLPQLFPKNGQKNYLVFLTNNYFLQPSGGELVSYAKLTVDNGQLGWSDGLPLFQLDNKVKDLGLILAQKNGGPSIAQFNSLRLEPDFINFAQVSLALYQKVTGEKLDGVISLDASAFKSLNQALGESADKLDDSFKSKEASRSAELAMSLPKLGNQLVTLNQSSLFKVGQVLAKNLKEKHLLLYNNDSKILSTLNSQNWSGSLSSGTKDQEQGSKDFLLVVETNKLTGADNSSLQRNFNLQTQIREDGGVSQNLKITYLNSADLTYDAHWQLFLPLGSKLIKASLNGQSVLTKFGSSVDHGLALYSTEIKVVPNSSTELELSYSLVTKVVDYKGLVSYDLRVIKQPGTQTNALDWSLMLPEGWQVIKQSELITLQNGRLGSKTDLSQDRKFELKLKKP